MALALRISLTNANAVSIGEQAAKKASSLIARSTTSTSATNALNLLVLLQIRLRNPAYTGRVEVCLFRLNALQTAELLISFFLPLCHERRITLTILDTPIIQCLANLLFGIHIPYVSTPLMIYLCNFPGGLMAGTSRWWSRNGIFHFVAVD